MSVELTDNGFIILADLPPFHESQLVYLVTDRFPNTTTYTMDVVGNAGASYPFYDFNFDVEKNDWKVSSRYMVEEPLEYLEKA